MFKRCVEIKLMAVYRNNKSTIECIEKQLDEGVLKEQNKKDDKKYM